MHEIVTAQGRPGRGSAGEPGAPLRLWVDVENPPQVQYLVPLMAAFERRGATVRVTARDYGATFDLLRARGVDFLPIGSHYGPSKRAKVIGTLVRTHRLRAVLGDGPRPHALLSVSRSASLAARSLGIPSFALCDYEYVDLSAFRVARTHVIHPDVIAADAFRGRGIARERLIAFHGIKEDVTFADIDLSSISPHSFPELERSDMPRVLVRPPAEESHYHRRESTELGRLVLRRLASEGRVRVVYSPRYEWQARQLEELEWAVAPLLLREPVPFVSLLRAVDVVVSGGGTMTREAAYLGTPAVSVFRGATGAVDRYLETIGRLVIVRSRSELASLNLFEMQRLEPLFTNRSAPDEIADAVLQIIGRRDSRRVAHSPRPFVPS